MRSHQYVCFKKLENSLLKNDNFLRVSKNR